MRLPHERFDYSPIVGRRPWKLPRGARMEIAVVGAGSWGTALAKTLADKGHAVTLWGRKEEHARAILLGPYTVEPVVPGHKIASGITNDRNAEFLDLIDHILAEAIRVRQLRRRIIDSFVNCAAEMFEK